MMTFERPSSGEPGTMRPRPSHRIAPGCRGDGSFVIPGLSRVITARIASTRDEFEQAFALVAAKYRERGYAGPGASPYRFTPYHALPGTQTIVAKDGDRVVATLSMVRDSRPMGLPMENVYGDEVARLRREGRHMAEITGLASEGLGAREFLRTFRSLIRLVLQSHAHRGGDSWVITVHPRHASYYRESLGFIPLGPQRAHPSVQGHPAEAYLLDAGLMASRAPVVHRDLLGRALPESVLEITGRPADHARYFAGHASRADRAAILAMLGRAEPVRTVAA